MNMVLRGGCACGEVKYKINASPLFTQACHCKNCKISTGSSFVIHTMIFEDDFSVQGEIDSCELPTGSRKGYKVYFLSLINI